MLYRSSTEFKNRDAKTAVCQPFEDLCSNSQPNPVREASHFIWVSRSGLTYLFSVVSAIFCFISSNCSLCSYVQINFVFILRSGLSGKHNCDRLGINFPRWWTDPIKDRSFLRFEGDNNLSIVSVLFDNGVMPIWVMLCPSHSILSFAKWFFKFCKIDLKIFLK